jgi:hypothetical protein
VSKRLPPQVLAKCDPKGYRGRIRLVVRMASSRHCPNQFLSCRHAQLPCPPGSYQLAMALNTLSLDVAFLAVLDPSQEFSFYQQIKEKIPAVAVVGFSAKPYQSPADPTAFLLKPPFSVPSFLATVRAAVHASHPLPHPNVVAILPAKAGGNGCPRIEAGFACKKVFVLLI